MLSLPKHAPASRLKLYGDRSLILFKLFLHMEIKNYFILNKNLCKTEVLFVAEYIETGKKVNTFS